MISSSFMGEVLKRFLADDSIAEIIVDLENVMYMDSTSTGLLIHMRKSADDRKKTLRIVNLCNSIKTMIRVVGLDEYFNIDDDYFRFPVPTIGG